MYGYEWISMFFQVQSLVKLFPPRASKDAELFTVRKEKVGRVGGGVSFSSLLISPTKLIATQQQNKTDFPSLYDSTA